MEDSRRMILDLFDLPGAAQPEPVSEFRGRQGRDAEQSKEFGRACLDEGDFEGAIEHYKRALEQSPDDAGEALIALGGAYEAADQAPEAMRQYRKALKSRASGEAHLAVGELLQRYSHHRTQLEYLQKAVELEPSNPFFHHKLSEALRGLGFRRQARVAALGAIAAKPEEPFYHAWLADLALEQGDGEQALQSYQAAVELSPGDDYLYMRTALAFWRAGKREQALRSARLANDLDPSKAAYAGLLVRFLREMGMVEEAEAEASKAEKMDAFDEDCLSRWLRLAGL